MTAFVGFAVLLVGERHVWLSPLLPQRGSIVSERVHYKFSDRDAGFTYVLVIQPRGEKLATLFCPSIEGSNPWTQVFESLDDAVNAALPLMRKRQQEKLIMTRDKTDWWLDGLSPVSG